ncbi:MAG: adenosine deaminase [Myxococcales bacterium]|nr:adenosine deaminase [Myxococcales bacterium]
MPQMESRDLDFFRKLPKTDLHVHLDGSLRLSTILELAARQGVRLPADTPEGLREAMHIGQVCDSLVSYLSAFEVTLAVLQTEEALYRAAYELAQDAAEENVRYMEVRYSPILHTRRGLRLTAVIEAVTQALRQAQKDFGIDSGVIICGIRSISPASSLEMAQLAVAYKNHGVVGFDLAGAEFNYPAKAHKDAFQLILKNNINCTAHAGEAYGPESVAQAIHYLGAHRIGHGVRLREDGDLLNYVNDHRIPLEICPSSNVQTGAVPSIDQHPIRFLYNFGVRVTVNTDNRLITDTSVSQELWLLHKQLGFDLDEIRQIVIWGFKSAFLPFHVKQRTLRAIGQELDRLIHGRAPDDRPPLEENGDDPRGPSHAPATS